MQFAKAFVSTAERDPKITPGEPEARWGGQYHLPLSPPKLRPSSRTIVPVLRMYKYVDAEAKKGPAEYSRFHLQYRKLKSVSESV
jgi:hypothetical protein